MGGLFSQPKQQTFQPPPLPAPEPPVAIPEMGDANVIKTGSMIKRGRGGTILAGQMTPSNIKKKKILG